MYADQKCFVNKTLCYRLKNDDLAIVNCVVMLILNGCKTAVTSLLRRKLPSATSVASYSCVSSKRCPSLATISFRKAQLPHHQSVSVFNFRSNFYTTTGCNTSSPMPPVDANGDASAEVSQLIKDNKVMMFSKSTCPFCLKLKAAFNQSRVEFTAIELDTLGPKGAEMQNVLLEISGQKTVPNVFINGTHIGKSIPCTLCCIHIRKL